MTGVLRWLAVPAVVAALVVAAFVAVDPLSSFTSSAPPVEGLTIERAIVTNAGIELAVRADGSAPVEIAQIQVDGAYWVFEQHPPGPLARLSTASLIIPYPWVLGETHNILLLSHNGVPFEHTIEVALPAPSTGNMLGIYALVGFFVGVVPVALGMLFYPALQAGGRRVFSFALALTLGLLAFLVVDTLSEALAFAQLAAPGLHIQALVWLVAAMSFLLLLAIGRFRGGDIDGVALATSIALGIGLHNLGEGLAIGSAFTTGAAALGTFLVIGFMLHNVSEGIGIVAPMLDKRPPLWLLAALTLLAGLPAIVGIWLGAYAFSPHWAAIALAVGVGAILQVIVEVGGLLLRKAKRHGDRSLSVETLSGVLTGVAIMYMTALGVPI